MKIFIGNDHAGFKLKEYVVSLIDDMEGFEVEDVGVFSEESADYPDQAKIVSEKVVEHEGSLGILICGTGLGMSMTANKFKGIRAALCHNDFTAEAAREHNNANVLCMGARVIDEKTAKVIVEKFLKTDFS